MIVSSDWGSWPDGDTGLVAATLAHFGRVCEHATAATTALDLCTLTYSFVHSVQLKAAQYGRLDGTRAQWRECEMLHKHVCCYSASGDCLFPVC